MSALDWFRAALPDLALTEQRPEDEAFVFELFLSDRAAMMAHATIPRDVMDSLIKLQYTSQLESWQEHHPDANYFIIRRNGHRIGRFVVEASPARIYLIDVNLLQTAREQGLGTVLLDCLASAAGDLGLPLEAHIALDHPALRMFLKKGFVVEDNSEFYYHISRQVRS